MNISYIMNWHLRDILGLNLHFVSAEQITNNGHVVFQPRQKLKLNDMGKSYDSYISHVLKDLQDARVQV